MRASGSLSCGLPSESGEGGGSILLDLDEWGRHSTNGSPSPASPKMWPHCITLSTCPFRWSDIPGSENEMETSAVEDFPFRMPDGAQKFLCLNLSRQAAPHRPSSHSSPAVITNAQQLAEERWRIAVCDPKCLLLARVFKTHELTLRSSELLRELNLAEVEATRSRRARR